MLLTDALFQGGLLYSAYQTLGRWYRFKASTERRFDDRELLAQARPPPRASSCAWGRSAAAAPRRRRVRTWLRRTAPPSSKTLLENLPSSPKKNQKPKHTPTTTPTV
jgi:hypothetical protein